jgi:hypothetical protein
MKPPSWVIPAAIGTAAGLAVVVISRVPFERIGAPPVKLPPPALVPVQVPGPGGEQPSQQSTAATGGLPQSETDLYRVQIKNFRDGAKIYSDGAKEMKDMGGLGHAARAYGKAAYQSKMATCLENQQKLKVTFYQAKATCMAATPET